MSPPVREWNALIDPLPTLVLPLPAWHKIVGYADLCPVEINGFGYTTRFEDSLRIDDVFILNQVASASRVESDEGAFGQHVTDMIEAGIPTGWIRLQWHSHVWGDTYCSHIDEDGIDELGGDVTDWMISLVVNKAHQVYAQLDVFQPFRLMAELPWRVDLLGASEDALASVPESILAGCWADIEAKVRTPRGRKLRLPAITNANGSTA